MDWKVRKAPRIDAEMTVPGDKSISHRAVMLASLTNGTCVVRNFLPGEDCLSTAAAMRLLGVKIEQPEPDVLIVHGTKGVLEPPVQEIDCGNSGTTMRLMSGILAAQPFRSRLVGDASLSRRPMRRVIEPLTRMGARIEAEGEGERPPLIIHGGSLHAVTYEMPVASAQVKSAVLLAGLFAAGRTTVVQPAPCRDHTERMLSYFLVRVDEEEGGRVSIPGGQVLESRNFDVPGDISSAAFWMVAAAAQKGSRLLIRRVGLNPTRTGLLAVLVRMGAHVREVVEDLEQVEPSGSVLVEGHELKGTVIGGEEIPNVIDEIPILAVAGALAEGTTIIKDAAELRVKESDRLAAIAANLKAMGADVTEHPDGLEIRGGKPLQAARLPSHGDHRIAMAFAVAGLFARGETVIEDVACVQTSYPGFEEHLRAIMKPRSEPRAAARPPAADPALPPS